MNILAFGASNSAQSINTSLAVYAANVFKAMYCPDAMIEVLDLNEFEMPIYSPEREKKTGVPERAQNFFDAMRSRCSYYLVCRA